MASPNKRFPLKSTAAELLAQARAETGIDLIEDAGFCETLERFVASLNTEAELNEAGAVSVESNILLMLCSRLRMWRDRRAHPEIAELPVSRPLFMTGGGRTGSTKLQKVLAATGDFLYLPCWQGFALGTITGRRGEDTAARVADADDRIRWINERSPNARLIHEYSTFEPEEDTLLLAHRFYASYMAAFLYVPSYVEWYMANHDPKEEFQFLKQALQYLQWQFYDGDARPWILKSPSYQGMETEIAQVFPDVSFVTTRRDMTSVIASACGFLSTYYGVFSDTDRTKFIGQALMFMLSATEERQSQIRKDHPEFSFIDFHYREVVEDIERVIDRIYRHVNMKMSDGALDAVRRWENENAQHKRGIHRYSLEDFGLSALAVKEKFGS